MGIRYSYNDFTTKGHGVIEYADPDSGEGGKKPKRRSKNKLKYATRWPSPAPMKLKSPGSKADSNKSLEMQAQEIFKKRFAGQQPKKGQIKEIMQELRKPGGISKKVKKQKSSAGTISNVRTNKPNPNNEIDGRVFAVYKRRFPGQKPQADQLKEIRQEVINARKKLGL